MKAVKIILILTTTTLFSNEIKIQPKMDLVLRYNQKDKIYSNLGTIVNGTNSIKSANKVLGGDIGFISKFENFDLVVQGSGVFSLNNLSENSLKVDKTFFDNNTKDFFYLSNFYFQGNINNYKFRLGRQQYNNELVNKNKRVISNQYEGLYVEYKKDKIFFDSLYFTKIASSTLANIVPYNHNYGVLGYGKGYKIGEFTSVSKHISNKNYNTNGALITNIKYGNKTNINIQNLYVDNFFNTLNINTNFNKNYNDLEMNLKLGFTTQKDVGNNYFANDYGNKKIDGKTYQGALKFKYKDYFGSYTLAYTPYDENAVLNGTLISPFSNKLGWIVGPQTAHSFNSDTKSKQALIGMKTNIYKIPIVLVYADLAYNLGKKNGLTSNILNTREKYYHAKLYFSKHMNLTIQYSKAKDIDPLVTKNNYFRTFLNYSF